MRFSEQLLPDYVLNGCFSLFSGAYSHRGLDGNDENFAVPILASFAEDTIRSMTRLA